MATVLAGPSEGAPEQPPAPESAGAPDGDSPASLEDSQQRCANCSAPLQEGQDWCFQCGDSTPGALASGTPGWRSAAMVVGLCTALVLGAGAAAYAAWGKPSTVHRALTVTVAETPPAATPPATTPAPTPPPSTAKAPGTPKTLKPLPKIPLTPVTPPKIPLTASTPKPAATKTTPSGSASTPSTGTGTSSTSEQPTTITLDTNAASTYNPYGYPASYFGDPSLAIDGEASTAWTAQVNPAVAPKMAEGLAIDLRSAQKLSSLNLLTTTPGMTVQVYGSAAAKLPSSITDPAWVALSPSLVAKNKQTSIKLRDTTKAFRFVTLWISRAPASSIGTPQAPGHVNVNEVELFPAS